LQGIYDMYPTTIDFDVSREKREPEEYKRNILAYQIEQKTYLLKLINLYSDKIDMLNKEDSL